MNSLDGGGQQNPIKQPQPTVEVNQPSQNNNWGASTNPKVKLKQKRTVPLFATILISAGFSLLFGLISFLAAVGVNSSKSVETRVEQRQEVISAEGDLFNRISSEVGQSVVSILVGSGDTAQAAGTGFVINDKGLIITNKHVVSGSGSTMQIVDFKNREYSATMVGVDPSNDIAFIRVEGLDSEVKPAKLADSSSVKVGDKVLAIGNALGEFQNSVTSGIISGLGRPIEVGDEQGESYESLFNLLQTDAAINPGNSGGPLVNMAGEVIGINTAIAQEAEGIGFSIPINDTKSLIAQVENGGGLAQRPFLGVQYVEVNSRVATRLNLTVDSGALVYAYGQNPVEAGSPAAQAGLQEYDVITKMGNYVIGKDLSLPGALAKFKPGESVNLEILRGGRTITITVILATR